MDVTSERLAGLFNPRSIVLVGASDKSRFSRNAFDNLVEFGFGAHTYLLNPRAPVVHGHAAIASLDQLPEPVDVAYIMTPSATIPDVLTDIAGHGIHNAVILSSGYAETGPAGRAAQQALVERARELDVTILGPNHLGFANFVDQIPVTSINSLPHRAGPVALLSQSGASSLSMLRFASDSDIGLSYMVTLGNEAMIDVAHVIDFLVDDARTRAIAVFLETIRSPRRFRAAAGRAAAAGKAIVVLKAGSSELAARTAAAHTGALVGDDRAVSAVLRELGVIRVRTIEDMLLTAGLAARIGELRRPGIGIVSISGGACDIVADRAEEMGTQLPALAEPTIGAIAAVMPEFGTVQNPLDVTGAVVIEPSIFTESIAAVGDDPSIGAVAVITSIPWLDPGVPLPNEPQLAAIGAGIARTAVPGVLVTQASQPLTDYSRALMDRCGIPHTIPGLAQSVHALGAVASWSERLRELRAEPDTPDTWTPPGPDLPTAPGNWSEQQARALLERAGVPVVPSVLVTSAEEAGEAAAKYDCDVALKVCSAQLSHKTEAGGVALGLTGADAVAEGFATVLANVTQHQADAEIDGVLVSPMRRGGLELLVGVTRDDSWGPMLTVALGGVLVELLDEPAITPLPASDTSIRRLFDNPRLRRALAGFRGQPAADLDALVKVVHDVAALARGLGPRLAALEINPLRVHGSEIEALDALIVWQ